MILLRGNPCKSVTSNSKQQERQIKIESQDQLMFNWLVVSNPPGQYLLVLLQNRELSFHIKIAGVAGWKISGV